MKKIVMLAAAFAAVLSGAPLKVAENGKALAGILIPQNAKPVTRVAANELALYLKRMTGAKFTVGTKSAHKVNFKIGFGNAAAFQPNEYVIRTVGNNIEIYGRDSEKQFVWFEFFYHIPWQGSLRGVYEFLDLQGVRWPNPSIEYVPRKKELIINDLDIRRKFDFIMIADSPAWDFLSRPKDGKAYTDNVENVFKWLLRIGFHSNRFHLYGCHTEYSLGLHKDPEWLANPEHLLLDRNGVRQKRFACWSHPDLLKVWIRAVDGYFSGKSHIESGFKYIAGKAPKGISKWPYPFVCPDEFMLDPMDNDGVNDGQCQCERCKKFRKAHPCADDTELIWDVIIKVAEYTQKKFPGKYITTLVYPPKQQLPKRKLPPNIKVRICLSGPKVGYASPELFAKELDQIKSWYQATGNRVPLWAYHCVSHGESMPYLVETYPRQIARYVKSVRKWISGIYLEVHTWNKCFTPANLDIYIHRRMMNDPDRDVEKELKDYFKATYGPAAAEGEKFFNELERLFADFWKKTVAPGEKAGLATPWGYGKHDLKRSLWTLTYTAEKLKELEKIVKAMERKTAGTIYAKQVSFLRKYMFDGILAARKKLFADEEFRQKGAFHIGRVKGVPTPADWQKASVMSLQQADRFSNKSVVPGKFRLLTDGKNIYCRAELMEPALKNSKSIQRRNGSSAIWKDNTFELFFFDASTKRITQLIFNDLGYWSSCISHRAKRSWKQLSGIKVSCKRQKSSWELLITIPISSVYSGRGGLRFNAVRERNIKGIAPEFSTWSSLSKLGEWHNHHTFPDLLFK